MRALTFWQPWAGAVLLGKPVENRLWAPSVAGKPYRGELAIHAGKMVDNVQLPDPTAQARMEAACALTGGFWDAQRVTCDLPEATLTAAGAIIGVCKLVDVHPVLDCRGRASGCVPPWPEAIPGVHHWVLRDVRSLTAPVPCRGAQRLWRVPEPEVSRVRGRLSRAHPQLPIR